MAKAKPEAAAPAPAQPMPAAGGHYRRDPATGQLTCVAPAWPVAAAEPPAAPEEVK